MSTPLKDLPDLDITEEEDALVGAVEDKTRNSRGRKQTFAQRFASLWRRNNLVATWEETTLFDGDAQNDRHLALKDNANAALYNLDIKQGATRHNFRDGYTHFRFIVGAGFTYNTDKYGQEVSIFQPAPALLNSSTGAPLWLAHLRTTVSNNLLNTLGIAIESDTSFRVGLYRNYQTSNSLRATVVSKIIGYKLVVKPQSLVR